MPSDAPVKGRFFRKKGQVLEKYGTNSQEEDTEYPTTNPNHLYRL